jgi:hypothetical protein
MMRNVAMGFVLALCAAAEPCHADEIVAEFTALFGSPSASGGRIMFSLNPDGTIAASLLSYAGGNYLGFGYDSINPITTQYNYTPDQPDYPNTVWGTPYGDFYSGFFCPYSCGASETWTIGNPGEYISVFQLLGGGHASYDFFMLDGVGIWTTNAINRAPEPGTLGLLCIALIGALGAWRGWASEPG